MVKEGIIRLDLKDREILFQLDTNARQSNSEIAKKIRLNKNVVNYRIKKLEESGIIKGYNTIIDFSKLGLFLFRVYIDFYEFDIEKEKEALNFLIGLKGTDNIIKAVGNWNIVADFYVKDISYFHKIFLDFLDNHRTLIKNYDIELVVKEKIFLRKYLIPEKKNTKSNLVVVGGSLKEKVDKSDQGIINLVLENARIPVIELASKLKITSSTAIQRMRKLLKKKIIAGYKVNLDLDKLNYSRYKIFFELDDTKSINEISSYCETRNFVVGISQAIGNNFDFRIDVEVNKFIEITDLIEDIKRNFPGRIRDYKYVRFVEEYKK